MAIGAIHIAWLRHLARQGEFRGRGTVLDLGPQDIQVDRGFLMRALDRVVGGSTLDRDLADMFTNGGFRPDGQPAFYRLFGLSPYASIDASDTRATYRLDLNHAVSGLPEYDVVTNFGTTEHVFNIGEAFRTIHNLTRPGGMSLHCVPCFAFINHGFYGINPNMLVEMARANDYEIVDFSYFDNAFVRNAQLTRRGLDGFDINRLPIELADMENTQTFMTKVVDLFHHNLVARATRREIAALGPTARRWAPVGYPSRKYNICFVFDLIFFAMRRPGKRLPFVMPMQDPAGVPPLKKASLPPS